MKQTKVLSLALQPAQPNDDIVQVNRQRMLDALEIAAALRPDFVVFSEIALHVGAPLAQTKSLAESVPGPSTDIACEHAVKCKTHVIWPMLERDGDHLYNAAVLIGRNGRIIGKYRKSQPTSYEMDDAIQPGDDVPVFQTDHGRVGMAICFDIKFPQVGLMLSRGKANIVFWPTMFQGGKRVQAWTRDYGFAMVPCSGLTIVDSTGTIVAGANIDEPLAREHAIIASAFAQLNLDRKTYHLDDNQHKLPVIKSQYGPNVSIYYGRSEGTFVLQSNMDNRTVEDIENEFELIDLRDYLDLADKNKAMRLSTR